VIRCLLIAIALLSPGCSLTGECENSAIRSSVSPDGTLNAWVFVRNCGATTPYSTHVSVLSASADSPKDAGNTFVIQERPAVSVEWASPSELAVTFPRHGKVFHQEPAVSGITVSYHPE
jgi:hypothetical protein